MIAFLLPNDPTYIILLKVRPLMLLQFSTGKKLIGLNLFFLN